MEKDISNSKIVFYDGECGLCQYSISYLYRQDKRAELYFAPLNGDTYKLIYKGDAKNLKSLIFFSDGKTYVKSEAFLELIWLLGGKLKFLYVFKVIPRVLRDGIYDLVASNRNLISCSVKLNSDRFLS